MTAQPADEATTDLTATLAEHRMNAVTEGAFPYTRTRVKCDGPTCDFYADSPRYWDAVREHDAHLTEVLAPVIRAERAAALDEAVETVQTQFWRESEQRWVDHVLIRGREALVGSPEAPTRWRHRVTRTQTVVGDWQAGKRRAEAERRGEPNG